MDSAHFARVARVRSALLRYVGTLPHGHAARAVFFRIAGSARGIVCADDVSAILSAILAR